MTHRQPTAAEAVVAETIARVLEETHLSATGRPPVAVKPIVQERTGASDGLYWRALAFANAWRPSLRDDIREQSYSPAPSPNVIQTVN